MCILSRRHSAHRVLQARQRRCLKLFFFFFFLKTSLKTNDKNRPSEVCPLSKAKKTEQNKQRDLCLCKILKKNKKIKTQDFRLFPKKKKQVYQNETQKKAFEVRSQ